MLRSGFSGARVSLITVWLEVRVLPEAFASNSLRNETNLISWLCQSVRRASSRFAEWQVTELYDGVASLIAADAYSIRPDILAVLCKRGGRPCKTTTIQCQPSRDESEFQGFDITQARF